jgi:3-phosphoshikimate 1-carboxyvinyltransferase
MNVAGWVRVPGDKSITHRALLLAAMAKGVSYVGGALTSLDARATAQVIRRLGAEVSSLSPGQVVRVRGRGKLTRPDLPLGCGNSGTTARLTLGLLAAHRFSARLTGDASLRRRPMRRVTIPLGLMGARFEPPGYDGLPLQVTGGRLIPIRYDLPVASAQVKSALLLAGYAGQVAVALREPTGPTRDHTERMFRGFGLRVEEQDGWIEFSPGGSIPAFEMQIPGDISSAAFLVGVAILAQGGELSIRGVGLNPTRTGFLSVLARMGAAVEMIETDLESGEPVGDLLVRPAELRGVEIGAGEIAGIIDEIPLLAVLATRARGTTVFREAGELRVKESDRLGLLAANIRTLGGRAAVEGNDLVIEGSSGFAPSGRIITDGDHRLAMAFAVLGTVPGAKVRVDNPGCAEVSFPGFDLMLRSLDGRKRRG